MGASYSGVHAKNVSAYQREGQAPALHYDGTPPAVLSAGGVLFFFFMPFSRSHIQTAAFAPFRF